jgi:hypothetical protein
MWCMLLKTNISRSNSKIIPNSTLRVPITPVGGGGGVY